VPRPASQAYSARRGVNTSRLSTTSSPTTSPQCLPNNHGSLAPIKVTAPKGSIVNAEYPSPVNARHVVGMYVPMPILKALHHVMPERVLVNGEKVSEARKLTMSPDDLVVMETPGGGGYGSLG
jgi:N-methylhydantoinase B/oxoprolinase/acetone carboxylase alpha subunit